MALTDPPREHPRSCWDDPALVRALDEGPGWGPVAAGGGLGPWTLMGAYRAGAFPWPAEDPAEAAATRATLAEAAARGLIARVASADTDPVTGRTGDDDAGAGRAQVETYPDMEPPWWCPDPRSVIPTTGVRMNSTLANRLRRTTWTTSLDEDFRGVVESCRRDGPDQWITTDLIEGYVRLHERGWAHSVEVWDGDDLVGGMYGVHVGRVFISESMFHRKSDASKIAVVDFADRFRQAGGLMLDVQLSTPHLVGLGAGEIPRSEFLSVLRRVRDDDVRLVRDRLAANRLAPPPKPPPQKTRARSPGPPAREV